MNVEFLKWVNGFAGNHPILDNVMVFISSKALFIYAILLISMWILGKREVKHTVVLAAVTGFVALLVNFLITQVYFEPRPFVTHDITMLYHHDADASFPSDHTTGALALSLAIFLRHKKFGIWVVVFGLLTGLSRIYVGHHYPLDVLGSLVVSAIVSLFVYRYRNVFNKLTASIYFVYSKVISILPFPKK